MVKKDIMISIKPEFVELIFNKSKRYEFRKVIPKEEIKRIVIYETYPIGQVVGEAEIIGIIKDSPDKLWDKTKNYSGVTKDLFDAYFQDRRIGYAYKLGKIKIYNHPLTLSNFGITAAPQGFVYLR